MFTGIVEDIGTITGIKKKTKESAYTIRTNKINVSEIGLGDSIAVSGICLTVIKLGKKEFTVDASYETLSKTTLSQAKLKSGVNLERSVKVGDRMGGHIVSGHVDGVGKVASQKKVGGSTVFWFSVPAQLSKYIVPKGSVAINGVSLTVNDTKQNEFSVNIIPFTQKETTFGGLRTGNSVNIECDIIGKYVEKFVSPVISQQNPQSPGSGK